ncbi:EI24 domain-containing protein [Falsirhodobacter xinxiangensis]|uniref:EI24 domain-containing protein n=1 Tax=Falsirhodobacter xinxiangensis TaxID=2530049 RepID=UPI0010AB04E7|nr:EI24 domain-containing protein [Rhodobacter xinxiangensis]
MLGDFLKALGQIGDRRFRRVVMIGVALTLALLVGLGWVANWAVVWLVPDQVVLPWIGPVGGLDTVAGWGSVLLMLVASVFLMVPVASAFTGLFLEDVAAAVEDRHYTLPPADPLPMSEQLREAAGAFGILLVANIIGLFVFLFAGPLAPLLFIAMNGFLLGREYFVLVAMRRIGRQAAYAMRRRHAAQVWLAGALMAIPLSVPILNLIVPVLGVATFTHLFHRLSR